MHLLSVGNDNSTTTYGSYDAAGNVLASSQKTGGPTIMARGNRVWHVQAYNNRLQPTETYEATNDSADSFLFISCP